MTDINEILNILPHRYPILLVDRILEFTKAESIIGIKNVTINEPHFQGHFPGKPIMPGVLILEAMAQLSGILAAKTFDLKSGDNLFYLLGIDNAKFRKIVIPGDTLTMQVTVEQNRGKYFKFKATARVMNEIVAEANITAMLTDRK
jgi:beta-hydroxyacyl-ACP dehydratase FabZ